jgi:GR25 family glycosyltransferase involved in LPS biosynthesis
MEIRIISVNTEDIKDFNSVQSFGHQLENGQKLRYQVRRNKIKEFISTNNLPISIFDAVTPNKFTINDSVVEFNNLKFELSDDSEFYISNLLSHYQIWKLDEDTLILEDDVILDKIQLEGIITLIDSFREIEFDNKALYLQLSTPWHESFFDKEFSLQPVNEYLGKYISGDLSGTSALFLTKECKKIILNNLQPLCACDKYFNKLSSLGVVQFYLPNDKTKMLRLDKKTSWL